MLQASCRSNLTFESLGTQGRRQLWMQHLERDRSVVFEVVREVYSGHAAAAQLAFELVAAC